MAIIKATILDSLLYNYQLKRLANHLVNQPFIYSNRLYQILNHLQINKIIKLYSQKPFALRIENTNYCNGRCFMCPHPTMKRPQGIMTMKLYRHLINQAVSLGINYLNLHNFGEPLIDHRLVAKIKYASQKGIKRISTNTNGQLLNQKLSHDLILSGLNQIYFSLDAASLSTYKQIRLGLDYHLVLKNITDFISIRNSLKVDQPKIIVDFLQTPQNLHETKKFIDLWKNKADSICISQLHDWASKKSLLSNKIHKNFVSLSLTPCRLPFTELTINWDGQAVLCCQDIDNEVVIGDANYQSLSQIWQSPILNNIRQKHLKLKTPKLPLCQNCFLKTFWWLF